MTLLTELHALTAMSQNGQVLRTGLLVALLAAGCGRFGFDPFGDDDDDVTSTDAPATDSAQPDSAFDVLLGDSHLVGYWKLDDALFTDTSQYGNAATTCYAACPTLAPGLRGMAADFHNLEGLQVGTVAPLSSLSTSLTLGAWVNLRTITDYGAVISNDRDCSNCQTLSGFSLWSSLYSQAPTFLLWNQSMTAMGPRNPIGNIATNTWVFLAGTYDNQTARLYIDGAQVDSQDLPSAIGLPHSYPLRIGHQGFDYDGGVDGLVDEVMIFDRALTPAEIQTIYTALKP